MNRKKSDNAGIIFSKFYISNEKKKLVKIRYRVLEISLTEDDNFFR